MNSGPVAQFNPMLSSGKCSTEARKASTPCPASMVPGRLDRAGEHDRDPVAELREEPLGCYEGGLDVARVLLGLDQEEIAIPCGKASSLAVEVGGEVIEGDASGNGNGLGRGSNRACDEAGLRRRAVPRGGLLGELSGSFVELLGVVLQAILGEDDGGPAEGVGLDDVGTGFEVTLVNRQHDVGTRPHEVFVTALQIRPSGSPRRKDPRLAAPFPSHRP